MADLIFPRELDEGLRDILGMPNFECGPIAGAFRDAGFAEIPRKSEAEQAFVLHWLVTLLLEHGHPGWRPIAADRLAEVIAAVKARAAKAGRNGGADG